jgi:hypothetical protein
MTRELIYIEKDIYNTESVYLQQSAISGGKSQTNSNASLNRQHFQGMGCFEPEWSVAYFAMQSQ